jgi:plastocyanin
MTYRWVGAIAGVSVLTLAACGSDSPSVAPGSAPDAAATATPKPPKSGPPSVTIRNNAVSPSTLEVETGATVKVRNADSVGHRLDNREDHLYSGTIPAKGKGEITAPPDPGTYVFTDPNHTSTRLKLKVR